MNFAPTPYPDVNAVLRSLNFSIQSLLGSQFIGMYLVGSLALGDFNHQTSDIDYVLITQTRLSDRQVNALKTMHVWFDTGQLERAPSSWAARVEAVYLPVSALRQPESGSEVFPQVEKGKHLFMAPLEEGWAFQLYTLRERSVVISGPDLRPLIPKIEQESLRRAVAVITFGWERQSRQDLEWLAWVHQKDAQSFVVLTLCRMLYTLATGDVTSKPAAALWASSALGSDWSSLIERALEGQHTQGRAPAEDVALTLDLLQFVLKTLQVK